MEQKDNSHPVPAPRRLYPELRKTDYENVTIEIINKNLNINTENILNSTNCTEKVPNNKIFFGNITDEEICVGGAGGAGIMRKTILTETNDLYGPNANENVPEPVYATPTPAPRPRKSQNNNQEELNSDEIYENTASMTTMSAAQMNTSTPKQEKNTGAISKDSPTANKALRKAPELPPKTYVSIERERAQRHSITSEFSTTSSSCYNISGGNNNGSAFDLSEANFSNNKLPKSASSATLNSSIADSIESAENSKFKSPSPGYVRIESDVEFVTTDDDECTAINANNNNNNIRMHMNVNRSENSCNNTRSTNNLDNDIVNTLPPSPPMISESTCNDYDDANDILKSLGTTSKLLTESIGERVASKAKGAKHKLDKNIKSSTELLSNLGSETSNRLKNVSKRFGTNFILNKKEKEVGKENMSTQYDPDRPQTLPPNDKIFNTISFSSPLQRKAGGFVDLSTTETEYETPRSLKMARSDMALTSPPSYEDALRASPKMFTRNVPTSQSLMVPKHISAEAANTAIHRKQRSNTSLNAVCEDKSAESSGAGSRDSIDLPSPPMPNFPPPTLPPQAQRESVYGKLNAIAPPARQKRRKNYEQIQLRRAVDNCSPALDGTSMRANVDSAELHQMNIEAVNAEREESFLLREEIRVAEECTPKPDRSESWEYYADNGDESDCSSAEPVYANHEATYGKVFEMATSTNDLLPLKNTLTRISEEGGGDEATAGAVGGWVKPPREIIQEFDPLLSRKSSTICRSDKSNQLLLLEHLLEDDTYGTVGGNPNKSDDDVSMCTSEEDNLNVTAAQRATSKAVEVLQPHTVVLPAPAADSHRSRKMQIVHQNAQLLSDSMENILDNDEARARPYLTRVDDTSSSANTVDLSRSAHNRTNWFVDENKENGQQARQNPFNKMQNFEDGECPPSYLEAIGADGRPTGMANEQKSRTARLMNSSKNVLNNVKLRVDALKRKSSFKAAQKSGDVKVTLQMIPRPNISPLLVRHEGPLIRFPSGVVEDILKEMQNRKAILRDRQFQTFLDQEMKTPKETIPLESITTVQCVSNSRVTDNATHFYCFEITTSVPKNSGGSSSSNVQALSNPNLIMTSGSSGNCKHQRVSHLYGVGKESERGVWMQKLLESLTNVIPPKYVCHYYRAGWCYLKNSITSEWSGTWLILRKSQRRLIFVTEASLNVEKMDLRKARCIVLKDSDETIHNLHVESGPMVMIDCPPFTVYMIMSSPRETKIWRHIISEVAHNNGFALNDQQLTKFNVPVIVDKCINFVYIHGSMSEGIYRKSGSENAILKLLAAFRADAFNVEITRNEYNEHDVANVLKRFMRDLPERLMGKLSESFMCVTDIGKATDKIDAYKELLARLSVIERETLKKIVGHLAFISSQKTKNKMSVQNLTMIWGPTLLQNHNSEEMVYSQKEADVLADLVMLYKNLFPQTPEDLKREQEMLMCLQKYYASAETLSDSVKKSGDLKVWITLNPHPENTTEEKTQVNVTLSPTKTAYEICKELACKMQLSTHQISLHEVILNDSLERPLHHETKVFDVVLNWSYWPEDDRKNNYLVVKPIDLLREVQRAVKNMATVTPSKELKFADNRTKSFKTYQCELRDGKIVISKKDKNDKTTIIREIFLHSTTAYLGCEKKRDFPWSWALTFVERTQTQILRSRDAPYIGHVLAGSEWVDRTIWYSSIWYCLYGDNILPPAEIIIK